MPQLWRVEVSEDGQPPLPAMHLEAPFVIGSSVTARVRLPAAAAEADHVRIEADGRWRSSIEEGPIAEGVTLHVGPYRIAIRPAAAGETPTPPQRTESLARELMRSLLGTAGAPTLDVVSGPLAGSKRPLAPPDSTLVIGRGDEAGWIIADDDLSRAHAEVRRTLDGTTIVDLDSKNGTKVGGTRITAATPLRDGARIELGKLALVFRDPAEKHLPPVDKPATQAPLAPTPATSAAPAPRASVLPFYAAVAITLLALGGLVWVLSS